MRRVVYQHIIQPGCANDVHFLSKLHVPRADSRVTHAIVTESHSDDERGNYSSDVKCCEWTVR